MEVFICLVDRTLGIDNKMGHDLLLAMTTQKPLPEIRAESKSYLGARAHQRS